MKLQKRVEEKRLQIIDLYINQEYSIAKLVNTLGISKKTVKKVIESEGL
jgi:hypothetical protein